MSNLNVSTAELRTDMLTIAAQMNELSWSLKPARGANRQRIQAEINELMPILRDAQRAYVRSAAAAN